VSGVTVGTAQVSLHRFIKSLKRFSVREAERLIRTGRITVNGVREVRPEVRMEPGRDRVALDGAELEIPRPGSGQGVQQTLVLLMNKPQGVVCTRSDEHHRCTVFDLLPPGLPYLFTVGRLDLQSEGALLLTNDGDLARRLADPRFHVPKTYWVKIQGQVEERTRRRLEEGVRLDRVRTRPCRVTLEERTEANTWTRWVLEEGKNRQIRRMCEAVGLFALKVERVAIGRLELGDLASGACRELTEQELRNLGAGHDQ
jgi:23S rRNA pseudouridine2605 synthase